MEQNYLNIQEINNFLTELTESSTGKGNYERVDRKENREGKCEKTTEQEIHLF